MNNWFSPYDAHRRIGSIIKVSPTEFTCNLTNLASNSPAWIMGQRMPGGEVNEFVFIDVGETTVFGKLVKVWLEGGERLSVDSIGQQSKNNHPIGAIQPLISVNVSDGKNLGGISRFPKLGSQVYSADPFLYKSLIEGDHKEGEVNLAIAELPDDNSVTIHVTPEKLFSRHCAILGATGGGKSWSVANLLCNIHSNNGRAILIDATGEYSDLPCSSFYIGNHPLANPENSVTFPHWRFTETDLRAFLRPSSQSQTPKLVEAIKSLKFVNMQRRNVFSGYLEITQKFTFPKAQKIKSGYESAIAQYSGLLENEPWVFNVLHEQIVEECIWPSGGNASKPDHTVWGGKADNDLGHCLNLISRIKAYSESPYFRWMLDPDYSLKQIPDLIKDFLVRNDSGEILRLDVSSVPFESNAREILVNAIGRYLLNLARNGVVNFEKPMLVFIDEAHQFLNKRIGDEFNRFELDAFGNIAKEGRKFGLNLAIATQRPRDIPEDVLSQIGSLLVHRLTNYHDQEVVKRAVGEMDLRTSGFLPTLEQGEALMLGVDFSFPVILKMKKPMFKPLSKSAGFSKYWKSMQ